MGEALGRIAITWPAASTPPTALAELGIAIDDPDTGEQMLDVVGLEMQLGTSTEWGRQLIEVALTRLVDTDGKPIGGGHDSAKRLALTDEYTEWLASHVHDGPEPVPLGPGAVFPGQKFRTGVFRYVVAEMRIAQPPATRREPRTAQYPVGGLGPAPTPFDTEARTITDARAARDYATRNTTGGHVPGTVEAIVRAGEHTLPRSMLEFPED